MSRLTETLDLLVGFKPNRALPFSLKQLLGVLVKHDGQNLHINAGSPPILRLDKELVPIGDTALSHEDCKAFVLNELNPEQRSALLQGHEVDFLHSDSGQGFRFHAYLERGCPSLSLRRVRSDMPKLMQLGLSGGAVERFLRESQGMMVVAGKPRCGKITTFSALVSHINQTRRARILTVEPKVQYWHKNQEGIVLQRELGLDTASFPQAIRQALNQDPDILAVGGIPDSETLELLLQAASSGLLVVALMDASSCIRALEHLLAAMNSEDRRVRYFLSRVIRLVVAQHLVQRSDGRGQLAAFEVLECTPYVAESIASGEVSHLHHTMRDSGMQTLARHLSRLVEVGSITREEAAQYVDPAELELVQHQPGAPTLPEPTTVEASDPLMSWL